MLSGFAAIALLPAMTGLPPEEAGRSITAALCNGGTVNIPLDDTRPAPGVMPCCAKGCRSTRRKLTGPQD